MEEERLRALPAARPALPLRVSRSTVACGTRTCTRAHTIQPHPAFAKPNPRPGTGPLTAEPEITDYRLKGPDDEFIVMGCDGVWWVSPRGGGVGGAAAALPKASPRVPPLSRSAAPADGNRRGECPPQNRIQSLKSRRRPRGANAFNKRPFDQGRVLQPAGRRVRAPAAAAAQRPHALCGGAGGRGAAYGGEPRGGGGAGSGAARPARGPLAGGPLGTPDRRPHAHLPRAPDPAAFLGQPHRARDLPRRGPAAAEVGRLHGLWVWAVPWPLGGGTARPPGRASANGGPVAPPRAHPCWRGGDACLGILHHEQLALAMEKPYSSLVGIS